MSFADFFRSATGNQPYAYQCRLACGDSTDPTNPESLTIGTECASRLISIPTGLGKTAAVVLAWLWNRVALGNENWPRRLVYCLPMRTLVEQTAGEVERWLNNLATTDHLALSEELLWLRDHSPVILMGGEENNAARREWDIHPEKPAILIGTQDMLLSRALNRGYGMSRARWPMHFGLLNNDALWVMDEAQLMDVGLATSAQLQAFRNDDRDIMPRPSSTWWISATLQPDWLKSPETDVLINDMIGNVLTTSATDRQGPLWENVTKKLVFKDVLDEKKLASLVADGCTGFRNTLVIVNTVKRASAVFQSLQKNKQLSKVTDIHLVHSRFRPVDRKTWRNTILRNDALDNRPRIIVATQVVEAGVDISADVLITDLAPWTSLVQRFGRAARYGGSARIFVVDVEEKKAAPYDYAELEAARDELNSLTDVAIHAIETHEASLLPERRKTLYPYTPKFLLIRRELEELFDTSADLSGADIDIARFIRSGEDNDCQIAWMPLGKDEEPTADHQPPREALCAVSIGDARKFIETKKGMAWRWDYLDRTWQKITNGREIYSGLVILARSEAGCYSVRQGFDISIKDVVPCEKSWLVKPSRDSAADSAQDDESLSQSESWQSIAEHGAKAAEMLFSFQLVPPAHASILNAASRWHDLGKAHPAFVSILKTDVIDATGDLVVNHPGEIAKAPHGAWIKPPRYKANEFDPRPGFRHELASALALLDLLRQKTPNHEALLGPWQDFFDNITTEIDSPASLTPINPIQEYLTQLSGDQFNLLLYLVASHHGKVRVSLQAAPCDQEHSVAQAGDDLPIRGIREGDKIPPITLTLPDKTETTIPETTLTIAPAALGLSERIGVSWAERCGLLLAKHGPFTLAWFETLVRAADANASK
jgi:CRISPR-associated endonuclease/helicase Cas3